MPVWISFLGVSTIYIHDGETHLLTDGFFSRPGKCKALLGRIAPDPAAIQRGLTQAGIQRLDAVLVGHSHYDHALDAPETARQTGAVLVGSESTRNIGRGYGLPENNMHAAEQEPCLAFGQFRVTFLPSRHNRTHLAHGVIRKPLVPPAHAFAYRDGGCFTILIEHPEGNLLVQESAGYLPGALHGRRADLVMLSVSGITRAPAAYREGLFEEVIHAVGAQRVVPIHFDDFTRPLTTPPPLMPRWVDDVTAGMALLEQYCRKEGIRFETWNPYGMNTI
jgi:L-ascorbate metabolism protein UlaG (beta-lactamase superfamily)